MITMMKLFKLAFTGRERREAAQARRAQLARDIDDVAAAVVAHRMLLMQEHPEVQVLPTDQAAAVRPTKIQTSALWGEQEQEELLLCMNMGHTPV